MDFITYKIIMKKHLENQINSLKLAFGSFNYKDADKLLNECICAIKDKKAIIATALGKNVPICEKFVGTLNSLGIDAHFVHTNSAIHGDIGKIHEGDVVLVLSKSGETEETVYLCRLLRKRKTKNWLISCKEHSISSSIIKRKIYITIDNEGDPWNVVPNNSSIAFLIFLQSICMAIIDKLPVPVRIFKANHPGGNIGKVLKNYEKDQTFRIK